MKAIVRDTYGSPDVLELRDIDRPEIGDEEVLVRVHAAGLDRGVWHVMTFSADPAAYMRRCFIRRSGSITPRLAAACN
jgi:NADPH:quinone reductase-like Zn-dependent oxidoreductase